MKFREFNILLIDDDEDDFFHLRHLVKDISSSIYKITWKATYSEGLRALETGKFDICLLDHRLGEQTGIDLLKQVDKNGLLCPIIFLTGYGDIDIDLQAMQMGAAEYLVKNELSAPLLERTLRYAMKNAFDMQQLRESKAQVLQQDRLASLGLLASSLAHEIGTPLGIIRSRSELIEAKASDEKLKSDMGIIITQIDRITKLVQSLLNLAREKRSDLGTAINFKESLQDVVNLLQPELQRKNIHFELKVPDHISVRAESGPLTQVLLNLMVNSVHALEEVKDRKKPRISVAVTQDSVHVEIRIEDNGCGIPEKNLPFLFQPFFTTKSVGQGTGLGLATSYKLIQSWDGEIAVESTAGEGTVFTIRLLRA